MKSTLSNYRNHFHQIPILVSANPVSYDKLFILELDTIAPPQAVCSISLSAHRLKRASSGITIALTFTRDDACYPQAEIRGKSHFRKSTHDKLQLV